ncbi:Carbohydrate-binding protein [Phytophthora megakarya]|uniref:Carbohydrate-binding protein n=1 Tax=Phytophthora megakarya TaxID=4795 RepID=A0A225WBQ3_9STRA|nr:Carbohydrate-binding protein [Phytophthora megakarya]
MFRNGVGSQATCMYETIHSNGGYIWVWNYCFYDFSSHNSGPDHFDSDASNICADTNPTEEQEIHEPLTTETPDSTSLDADSAEDVTISVTPEMKFTSAPSTHGSSGTGNDQTISTQSEDTGTSTGIRIVSIVGTLVVVAAVAAVVIVRRKKKELEAIEPKDSFSAYSSALTPRREINVMHA